MTKSRDAFRTISEVSEWLDIPAHVLRFWESRFSQIKPVKRAGGRRYYRPNDMLLIGGLRRLLHDDGITIKGVQKILREKGVKYVSSLCLELLDDEAFAPKVEPPASEETPIEDILVADESPDNEETGEKASVLAEEEPVPAAASAEEPEADDPEDAAAEDDGDSESIPVFRPAGDSPRLDQPFQIRQAIDPRPRETQTGDQAPRDGAAEGAETRSSDTLILDRSADPQAEPENTWPDATPPAPSDGAGLPRPSGQASAPTIATSGILAVDEIDKTTQDERIVALYNRLQSLRDRMRASMNDG